MQFTSPPENYRRDSENGSRLFWVWGPILSALGLIALTAWDADFMFYWLLSENHGMVEFLHAFLPFVIACIGLYLLTFRFVRRNSLHVLWCIALVIGGIYLAGEESSWGQHYVGWSTPEFWADVNDQMETNLHNTSEWFDQKPRLILLLGIVLTGGIFPFVLLHRPSLLPRAFDWTYTPLIGVPLAWLVLIVGFWKEFLDFFELENMRALRGGEFQELYIVWYLFGYTLYLVHRARRTEQEIAA